MSIYICISIFCKTEETVYSSYDLLYRFFSNGVKLYFRTTIIRSTKQSCCVEREGLWFLNSLLITRCRNEQTFIEENLQQFLPSLSLNCCRFLCTIMKYSECIFAINIKGNYLRKNIQLVHIFLSILYYILY